MNAVIKTVNFSAFALRRDELVQKDKPQLVQAASERRGQRYREKKFHTRNRVLPILQATTSQAAQSAEANESAANDG